MDNTIILQQPDEGEYKGKGSALVEEAKGLRITNSDEFEHAGQWLTEIKGVVKPLWDRLNDPCMKAKAAHFSMVAIRDAAMKPYTDAEGIIKGQMAMYNAAIEEQRRVEYSKAQAKAQKDAEQERARQIEEAKRKKDKEAVNALKSAPLEVAPVAVKTPEAPKVAGVSFRKVWKVQSVDESKLPARYLMPDMKAIESTVKGLGSKHGIPGVVAIEEIVTSVRS